MPTFDVDKDEIIAFEFEGTYLFKEYFDEEDLFAEVKKYYNSDKYGFEVPKESFPEVRKIFDGFFYDIQVPDNIKEYCVALERSADSSNILRNEIVTKRKGRYDIFLMKDEISVHQLVENGAVRVEKPGVNMERAGWKIT